MRKKLTLCCVMTLSLFLAGSVFAQNPNAYFLLDTDLATKGYQSTSKPAVSNIGATKEVGFAVYGLGLTDVAAYTVTFKWDSAKASFRKTKSGVNIIDDPTTINGVSITPPAETSVIGSSPISAGEDESVAGQYTISFARAGSGTTTATGLLYFGVFRTVDTFKTSDQLDVTVTIQMSDSTGRTRDLGARHFTVNGVDVKTSTWGEVKNQFKNF